MGKKCGSSFCVILGFALVICFSYTVAAFAQIVNNDLPNRKGIKVGDVIFHSALNEGYQFDSNIFLSNDATSDSILVTNPSVGIEVPIKGNKFSVEYNAFLNNYLRHTKENHTDHKVEMLGEIKLTDYKINVSDLYNRFTSRASSETSARIRQEQNGGRVGISAQFEKLGFDVGYTNKLDRYLSNEVIFNNLLYSDRNSMSHIMDATGSYRFMPKTSVLFESDLGFVNYDHSISPDSYFVEALAGIKGEPSNNLTVNLRGGCRYQDYDSSALLNDDKFVSFVMRGGADYKFTKDDIFNLKLERADYESVYQNMNYYVANLAGLNYTHNFTDKLSGRVFGSYQLHTYPKDSVENGDIARRKDNLYGGGFGVRYDVRKWLSGDLKYEYTRRSSKFTIYNFEEHMTMLSVTIGF